MATFLLGSVVLSAYPQTLPPSISLPVFRDSVNRHESDPLAGIQNCPPRARRMPKPGTTPQRQLGRPPRWRMRWSGEVAAAVGSRPRFRK